MLGEKYPVGRYNYMFFKNRMWLRVFFHNFTGKVMFNSEDEAIFTNSSQKFSILSLISDVYRINGKYEFILEYPDDKLWWWWSQKNNPIYEIEVEGVYRVDGFESYFSSVETELWGGLVKTSLKMNERINSLLDGNPGVENWNFGIGMYNWTYYPRNELGFPPHEGSYSTILNLWLRVPYFIDFLSCLV